MENPAGLNGFAFLEFSGPDNSYLDNCFKRLGFTKVAQHKRKKIELYQQGEINFLLNSELDSQATNHAKVHGAGACAMGFAVKDKQQAFSHVVSQGAKPFHGDFNEGEINLPAIHAIGGSLIYFVDDTATLFQQDFDFHTPNKNNCLGLTYIDHLTHNVFQGNMDTWANFYIDLFNFKQIRYFDIEGKMTGLISRAMGSPCGKIKIPLNESKDSHSQIEEFLTEYAGEGIQHIALGTSNIYASVEKLRANQLNFLDVPSIYYEAIQARINWHKEPLEQLEKNRILIDGGVNSDEGLLLQIFTENLFGPAFFEIIQRKGNDGFGEGNFQALFEAIERDQLRRGILKPNQSGKEKE